MKKVVELGELEQIALLAVWRLRDDLAYTVSVRDEIKQRTGRAPSLSTVYLTLARLEDKGALASSLAPATAERGGKRKRSFRITKRGVTALRRARARMDSLWEGLKTLGASGENG